MHSKGNVSGWEAMQTKHCLLFPGGMVTRQKGIQQTQGVVDIEGVMPIIGPGPGPC